MDYTIHPQKFIWNNRTINNHLPKTKKGAMELFLKINKYFNFYKSLEIGNINAEILAFWTKHSVKITL